MTARLTDLIERQNKIWARMQEIDQVARDGNRDWTTEERTNYDAAETDLVTVSGDIERLQRAAQRELVKLPAADPAPNTPPGPASDDPAQRDTAYAEAFGRYMRHGMDRLNPDQRELLMANHGEIRAQGVATDAAGGFFVPEEFRSEVVETMKAYGGLINHANVITTSGGADLVWPTNDDTANTGAILAENTQITEQDVTLAQRKLGAYVYTSKLVRVSLQLLQDSAFDLNVWLPRKLGERIGRAVSAHLVAGTGTNEPTGLVPAATVGKTGAAGQITTITYDDLIDLEHSIDPAYRPNARFVMSDAALKVLRKLKDADGRPLWQPIPAPGFPPTLDGYPYTIDNGMAAPAANARSVLFGDINAGFIVRQVQGVQMVRLAERYMDFLQVGFFGFTRLDARPDDPSAVRVYVHPAA